MLIVFYGEQEWGRYERVKDARDELSMFGEVFQGCFIYDTKNKDPAWFRGDFTPVLLADVPPVLRTMVLLME